MIRRSCSSPPHRSSGRLYALPKLLPTLEALCSVHLPPTPQHIRSTFNEIRQGVPGISTALLAQRLEALERSGVLLRVAKLQGRGATYELTEMGKALRPVCDALGPVGARWLEIESRHLDPAYMRQQIRVPRTGCGIAGSLLLSGKVRCLPRSRRLR